MQTVIVLFVICFIGNIIKLSGLLTNTSYTFDVRAWNAVGAGNSFSVSVSTSPPRKFCFTRQNFTKCI